MNEDGKDRAARSSLEALPQSVVGAAPFADRVRAPLWLLVLVTLSGTMAMHIFVPALPVAGSALHASPASMQQTITLYVVGLAVGQLIYGPISDAWGRRPALLMGLGLYLGAGLLALFAPSLEWLLAARLLQALGGAAGITLGRAIVRDTSTPARMTKDLALLNLLTLVGPGLSPIIGSYLAEHFGWRAIYVFLVCMGCAMVICSYKLLPETSKQRSPLAVAGIASDYRRLLGNPVFVGFMLGGSCSTTALYPYLATVPYIVHEQLGYPISQVGWFAAVTIVGASVGTLITRRLTGSVKPEIFLYAGAALSCSMAVLLLLVYQWGALNATALVLISFTMTMGAGLASPAALSRSLSSAPGLVGSAAGFYGFGQMAMGAIGTKLVGYGDDPTVACAVTQIAITALALASYRFAQRRSPV
ncbi:multidrug effflux MFS transporter [Comamonas aquatilis]|uniref:multidrug effflux MFS transporter n=1 Tax=Comamonas aquatilis TaxID=1778406 RepID=UPI0039F0B5EF